jgi:hypothetical protein
MDDDDDNGDNCPSPAVEASVRSDKNNLCGTSLTTTHTYSNNNNCLINKPNMEIQLY